MPKNKLKNMAGLKIEKKDKENSKQLVNRFMRQLRQSGILYQAKESRYRKRPLSWKSKIRTALRKEELRKQYEKLEKWGKI
jgi:23S rRNA G2069 N7-methylase RlmK/C1962 C5-methylase RlmI